MAARDPRQLREEAAAAAAAGKYKRALEGYNELERIEPNDAQWPKRAAEMLRRLGKLKEAVAAYDRAVDRYTAGGFLVQAIAVCKLILQLDPTHRQTQLRLSAINEQQGNASTRIGNLAESNVALHDNPAVAALRDERLASTRPPPLSEPGFKPVEPRTKTPSGERPALATGTGAAATHDDEIDTFLNTPRTRTGNEITVVRNRARQKASTPPITLNPEQPIEQVRLGAVMPGAHQHRDDGSQPGILVIPLDDQQDAFETEADTIARSMKQGHAGASSSGNASSDGIAIEVLPFVEISTNTPAHELEADDIDDAEDLRLEDLEEVPLPEPRLLGAPARRALADTPLFAGLPMETLEALITELELVSLLVGEVVFREGELGDALFIVSEGEVAMSSEGPPRVEMTRLGPGAFFGEVSLITEGPRTATVTAIAPTELIKIHRRAINKVIGDHPDVLRVVLRFVRDRLVERLVRTSPLFRPFDDAERKALADRFRFLEVERGAQLLTPGQRADGLYIVLAGRFEVVRDSGDSLILLGPGDLIGSTSLITGEKVTSPVSATTKSLALCLPAAQFRELIMTHPHVLEYVGEQVEARRKVRMI
jgi:CRP-like cAMP-binding protein